MYLFTRLFTSSVLGIPLFHGIFPLFAKDIVKRIPALNYCIAVFNKEILVETFTLPFNKLHEFNELSTYLYLQSKVTLSLLRTFDGNNVVG